VERPDTREIWEANAGAWVELSRAGYDVYRDLVNTPAFLAALPDVRTKVGLDLGCGEGHNTRLVADRGAHVIALDISPTFLAAAAEQRDHIRYVEGDGAVLPFRDDAFDFVVAFMSLMDVADPEATLREIARVLRAGGFVQFSIVHPATSTSMRNWVDGPNGERQALAIAGYFEEGTVTERWLFSAAPDDVRARHEPFRITYARLTLAGWLNAVAAAGLTIEFVAEPCADEPTARDHPEVADTRIVPYFLHVRARRLTPRR
jgi:SAM-dependent methyltransferase